MNKFIVLRDTKEKEGKGWQFSSSQYCGGTMKQSLKTGDYTILGYEDKLCIERKGCISEFAGNLMEERFYKELDRMELFKYSYLILEFSLKDLLDYPYVEGIPYSIRKRIKVRGYFLLKKLCEIQMKYKTHIIFAGDKTSSKEFVMSIFKRMVE